MDDAFIAKMGTTITIHIFGLDARTTGGGNDVGDHISYAAENACAAVTKNKGWWTTIGHDSDPKALILRLEAKGEKICRTCRAAAGLDTAPAPKRVKKAATADECTAKRPVPMSYDMRRMYPRGTCADCGQVNVPVTSQRNLRKHKRPA